MDAKTSITGERLHKVLYSEAKNAKIFRELYVLPSYNFTTKIIARFLNSIRTTMKILQYILSRNTQKLHAYNKGISDAEDYLSKRRKL